MRNGNIALLKLVSKPDNTRYRSACLQATFKYQKKKKKKKKKTKKSAKKRQSSQDLRLLGWRLNPALPGALSTTLQERTVTAKTMFNMIQKTVQGGDCQMQRGGE